MDLEGLFDLATMLAAVIVVVNDAGGGALVIGEMGDSLVVAVDNSMVVSVSNELGDDALIIILVDL
jgi:hypothetical protein